MKEAKALPALILLAGAASCGGGGDREDRVEAGANTDLSEAGSVDLLPFEIPAEASVTMDGPPVADDTSNADIAVQPPHDAATSCGLHDGRRFPVGSVFSDGCGCCICTASGGGCYGGNVCIRFVDGGMESFMSLPPCLSDEDCTMMIASGAVCVFDPGCSPGQGRCVSNPLATCPSDTGDVAHDYCGCDGQTFQVGIAGTKSFPDRPYAHLGACP